MRGVCCQWADHQDFGFVLGADNREYILREDELPKWMQARRADTIAIANGTTRVGMIVEFDAVEMSCEKVFVLGIGRATLLRT